MARETRVKLRQPGRFGAWLVWLIGLLSFVVLAWTGFWLFAAHEAAASLDAWMAREKLFRRHWSCPDRQVGGYPVAIAISCAKPQFAGMIFGRPYAGSLASFLATAEFAHPSAVTVNVASPFVALSDDKSIDLNLTWDSLAVHLGGLPQNVVQVSIAGRKVKLEGHAPTIGPLSGRAEQVNAVLTHDAARPDNALAFHIVLDAASVPIMDAFLGSGNTANATADGVLTQAGFDPAKTLAQTLDQWRALGGHMNLTSLTIMRGETQLQAHGVLGLDAAHEVQGRLDTKCVGFEPVLVKLGIDPALVSVGSLLTNLLGGGGQKSGPQPLHLPIGFTSGRLSIGPVQTSIRLPPIY